MYTSLLTRRLFSSLSPRILSLPTSPVVFSTSASMALPNPTPPPTCTICESPTYDCDLCGTFGSKNVSCVEFYEGRKDVRETKMMEIRKSWGFDN